MPPTQAATLPHRLPNLTLLHLYCPHCTAPPYLTVPQKGLYAWVSGVTDNAVYPVLFLNYLQVLVECVCVRFRGGAVLVVLEGGCNGRWLCGAAWGVRGLLAGQERKCGAAGAVLTAACRC